MAPIDDDTLRAFLREAVNEHGDVAHTDNARDLIDEALARRLIRNSGKFRMAPYCAGSVALLGAEVPIVGTMTSLYPITAAGRFFISGDDA